MDIQQIAQSVAASLTAPINYGANINDAGGNAQVTQNIRNLGLLQGQGDIASRATQALGVGANAQDDAEKAAAKIRAQKAQDEADAAQKELDYINDPKNYKAVINDVGGYDFYDSMGGKISPVEYAKATNKHITDLYKDSQDPNDKRFTEDYNQLFSLGKAMSSGNKDDLKKIFKDDPALEKIMRDKNLTYQDVVKKFQSQYSGYLTSPNQFNSYGNRDLKYVDKNGVEAKQDKKKKILGLF